MKEENTMVRMVPFSDEFAASFTILNTAWLEKYFVVEPVDHEMLGNPKQFYIDKGGYIFFAKLADEIVGTFALLKLPGNIYELSKMAVSEKFQGRKIGNTMIEFCIAKAKELGAIKIILYSSKRLEPAIHLYRKFGFKEVPIESLIYKRSDIKMELGL